MTPHTRSIQSVMFMVITLILLGSAATSLALEVDDKERTAINGSGPAAYVTVQKAILRSPKDANHYTKSSFKSALPPSRDAFDEVIDLEKHLTQASRTYWSKQLDSSR